MACLDVLGGRNQVQFCLLIRGLPLIICRVLCYRYEEGGFAANSMVVGLPSKRQRGDRARLIGFVIRRAQILSRYGSRVEVRIVVERFSFLVESFCRRAGHAIAWRPGSSVRRGGVNLRWFSRFLRQEFLGRRVGLVKDDP